MPKTSTLRRGILSVSETALKAPTADNTEFSRLYPSCWELLVTPRMPKMTVLKYPRPFPENCPKMEIMMTWANRQRPLWVKKNGRSERQGQQALEEQISGRGPTVQRPLVNTIQSDSFSHLFNLQEYESRLRVTVPMVLGQEVDSLCLSTIGHEPTRRLREEKDTGHDDDAGKSLEGKRNSPRRVILDEVAPVCDCGGRDGTSEPAAVVEAYSAWLVAIVGLGSREDEPVHRPRHWGGDISMAYAGAATVMMAMPRPRMKRPTTNWATCEEDEMITTPRMTTTAPANMAFRRPNLSVSTAANGAPTIDPLQPRRSAYSTSSSSMCTYTVYREKITATWVPVCPV